MPGRNGEPEIQPVAVVINLRPAWFAGFGGIDVQGEQAGLDAAGEQRQQGISAHRFHGYADNFLAGFVDGGEAKIDDGSLFIANRLKRYDAAVGTVQYAAQQAGLSFIIRRYFLNDQLRPLQVSVIVDGDQHVVAKFDGLNIGPHVETIDGVMNLKPLTLARLKRVFVMSKGRRVAVAGQPVRH